MARRSYFYARPGLIPTPVSGSPVGGGACWLRASHRECVFVGMSSTVDGSYLGLPGGEYPLSSPSPKNAAAPPSASAPIPDPDSRAPLGSPEKH